MTVIEEVTGPGVTGFDVFAYLMVKAFVKLLRSGVKENWLLGKSVRRLLNSMPAPEGSNNLNPAPLSVASSKAT